MRIGPLASLYRPPAPSGLVLTLSGNEITDATRAAGVQGDGLSNDSSFGIWEATTNLCTNGGFETNTTGWTTGGTNTLAASAEQAKFGAKSCKFTYQDNTLAAQFVASLSAAKHIATAWVYVPTAYDGTIITFRFNGFTGATAVVGSVNANLALRDQWQRLSIDSTPDAGDVAGTLQFVVTAGVPAAGKFFYWDGVQIEAQPIATPYVETDGGTTARSAARVQAPMSLINATQGWVAARVRVNWAYNDVPTTFARIFDCNVDGDNGLHVFYNTFGGAITWAMKSENGGVNQQIDSANQSFAKGDILTIIGAWTADLHRISVDGSAFGEAARTNGVPDLSANTTFDIGREHWQDASHADMDFLWFACGTGTLTDADAAHIHRFGSNDPNPEDFPRDSLLTGIWDARRGTMRQYAV